MTEKETMMMKSINMMKIGGYIEYVSSSAGLVLLRWNGGAG